MKKYAVPLISLILFLVSSSGHAFYITGMTGEDLLRVCTEEGTNTTQGDIAFAKSVAEIGVCLGYLAGIIDMSAYYTVILSATNCPNKKVTYLFCIPDDATPTQKMKVVIKYLNDHPEELNKPAIGIVIEAYQQYFPCPTSQ